MPSFQVAKSFVGQDNADGVIVPVVWLKTTARSHSSSNLVRLGSYVLNPPYGPTGIAGDEIVLQVDGIGVVNFTRSEFSLKNFARHQKSFLAPGTAYLLR
jgi:hypothetical protein